ncbi:A24 family peptidase C-terminal domain-containing protein [Thermococcus sp. Bubb.Bath]|uniref:A24 family peptidase C-terminal domain-containing protein n=1 Tax=Thermococcus sp. Bubb.Bath TaxID=1638242 RepID=UPI001438ED21|nr:A24 family peptidase C-terminal domain-containing protein [Thermococcus sp. Bubb.Bath]NJF24115.1 transposase [Thermococcus sp. Bubb.Bath]
MLAYEVVVLIVGSTMGILTSYTDMKTGFIFDNHAFPLLGLIEHLKGAEEEEEEELPLPKWVGKVIVPAAEIGILLYLYLGLRNGDILLALSGLIGLIFGFILGMVLYYAGAWASGDVVVLAAFSALLPLPLSYAKVVAPYESTYPLYPLSILFNSILAIFPFLFFYALGILLVRRETEELKAVFTEGFTLTMEVSLWVMAGIGAAILLENHGIVLNPVVKYLLTLVIIAVFGKYRKAGDAVGLAVLGYLLYVGGTDVVYAYGKLFAVLYVFKVFFSVVKVLRRRALVEEVPVEELREWDILGETIYLNGDDVVRDRRDFFEALKDALLSGNLKALSGSQGEVIASPSAEGLSGEQVEKLKELVSEGKLENRFIRKKSMPFAPSIFLGFLISALWGDIFWWLILKTAGL